MISAIILTYNEEADLPECLRSLDWCDDVHVVDSGSTDQTCRIAEAAGAQVYSNPFKSFGEQRNWALDHCTVKHEWIYFIDADEMPTPEFVSEVQTAIESAESGTAGFYCCWKTMLYDTWLKRSDNFPKWQFRILRKGKARFTDYGHGQKEGEVQGAIGYIKEPYLHYAFSKGWDDWERKHRKYAKQEAQAWLDAGPTNWSDVFSTESSRHNPALKPLLRGLPGWPSLRFLATYVLKGGFSEGKAGLEYCRRMKQFEKMIRREKQQLSAG